MTICHYFVHSIGRSFSVRDSVISVEINALHKHTSKQLNTEHSPYTNTNNHAGGFLIPLTKLIEVIVGHGYKSERATVDYNVIYFLLSIFF